MRWFQRGRLPGRKTERFLGPATAVLLLVLVGGALGFGSWQRAEQAYDSAHLIRLHVVANSDSRTDQETKLAVRDAVLREMAPIFGGVQDVTEARRLLQENLERLAETVRAVLRKFDCPYDVQVRCGRFPFPDRTYGSLLLPAGDYEALQVVLGSGAGHNWWCVLFPPLCFTEASGVADAFADCRAAPVLADGKVGPPIVAEREAPELRFACLDWLRATLGRREAAEDSE